jgi:hypothetical protein
MSFNNVGGQWDPLRFKAYLATLPPPAWATSITLHHTGVPSLAQRPKGFTPQHIQNLLHYYKVKQKWSAGPHFFIDEKSIWGMTPPQTPGVHAVSFNSSSIGIEVLGNYNLEDPLAGRGMECWLLAAKATKELASWLSITPSPTTIKFHRDDPKTRKTCPGTKVGKEWFLGLVGKV